jgi:hypothetical protein
VIFFVKNGFNARIQSICDCDKVLFSKWKRIKLCLGFPYTKLLFMTIVGMIEATLYVLLLEVEFCIAPFYAFFC